MADTVQKFNSHFCKSVALAFCGNDVSDDFILPANRQCEYMGHVGKWFLKPEYGRFCFALRPVFFCFVSTTDIYAAFINDSGPDEGRQGGSDDFRNFCHGEVFETGLQGAENHLYGIKSIFGSFCLFWVPDVGGYFKNADEKTDCDGIRDKDRKGEEGQRIWIRYGFRPGEKCEKCPKKNFKKKGINKCPKP